MATVRRSTDVILVTLFMAGLSLANSFYFVPSTVGRGALAAHGTSHPTTQAPVTEPPQVRALQYVCPGIYLVPWHSIMVDIACALYNPSSMCVRVV